MAEKILIQSVNFQGGFYDGRIAKIWFTLPFTLDATVTLPECSYKLVRGTIAQFVAKTQKPVDDCVLVMVPVDDAKEVK